MPSPGVLGALQITSGDGVADNLQGFLNGHISLFEIYDGAFSAAELDQGNSDAGPRLICAGHAAEQLGAAFARRETARDSVTYHHLLFDRLGLAIADGAPSECVFPGRQALASLDGAALKDLFTLFPALAEIWAGVDRTETVYGTPALSYLTPPDLKAGLARPRTAGGQSVWRSVWRSVQRYGRAPETGAALCLSACLSACLPACLPACSNTKSASNALLPASRPAIFAAARPVCRETVHRPGKRQCWFSNRQAETDVNSPAIWSQR